jgi:carbon-monoxide dehydrogenase small subunit
MVELRIRVNGEDKRLDVRPNETLLDVLRNRLNLKSVKAACWRGECGLCTVLLDGKPVKSCLVLAAEVDGSEITTVEGLGLEGRLSAIQRAFVEKGAIQCGFCTPAFVLVAESLSKLNPALTEAEIREAISGVLCRCTGYKQIVEAILSAISNK